MTAARWRQCLAVLIMALATALGPTGTVTAQNEATRTLTILAARCPAGYTGDAPADECDDSPLPGVTFRVRRPFTDFVIAARTDDAGVATFDIADLPYRGTVRIIEELPPGTARVIAFCVDHAGTSLPITDESFPDNEPPIAAALVTVGDAGDVRCDWYNVPVSLIIGVNDSVPLPRDVVPHETPDMCPLCPLRPGVNLAISIEAIRATCSGVTPWMPVGLIY